MALNQCQVPPNLQNWSKISHIQFSVKQFEINMSSIQGPLILAIHRMRPSVICNFPKRRYGVASSSYHHCIASCSFGLMKLQFSNHSLFLQFSYVLFVILTPFTSEITHWTFTPLYGWPRTSYQILVANLQMLCNLRLLIHNCKEPAGCSWNFTHINRTLLSRFLPFDEAIASGAVFVVVSGAHRNAFGASYITQKR